MRGQVELFRNGKLWHRTRNIVCNGAFSASANLAAGITAGNAITLVGYGTGTQTPSANDTGLSGSSRYYNAIGTHSFPSLGAVQFNFAITSLDYAATPGINIQEIGLFGNTGTASVPISSGIVNSLWVAQTGFTVGQLIKDTNNNIQRCTTAGTSQQSPHPVWATAVGSTTNDGSAVWTMVAGGILPVPMWAHALVPAFTFTGAANYTGNWQIAFF